MSFNIKEKFKNISKGYIISMGILFLFVGMAISSYTKNKVENETIKKLPSRQLEELVALLKESETKKTELEKQLTEYRKEINNIQKHSKSSLSKLQLDKIYKLAGLTEVKSKGIIIKIDDTKSSKLATAGNDGLIHSDDLLKLVNELKSAGATAISINNQRLVTTSEVVESGGSVMINQTRLSAPYIIKAVGDPEVLKTSLEFRGSIVEYLRFYGIDIKIDETPKIVTVSAYTGKIY